MTRFMRSARMGSKSARWQTTSRVLSLPATGRASVCSAVMPANAWRSRRGPSGAVAVEEPKGMDLQALRILDKNGKPRIVLKAFNDGAASVQLVRGDGTIAANLAMDANGEPFVGFNDPSGDVTRGLFGIENG